MRIVVSCPLDPFAIPCSEDNEPSHTTLDRSFDSTG